MTPLRSKPIAHYSKDSGYHTLADSGWASHFMDEWPGDHQLDCRRANLSPANNIPLLMVDQTANVGSGIAHDVYPYLSSNFENLFHSDSILPATIDYPLLSASPLNLLVLEPFLEAGIDGSESSWSSPSSAYSALYTTDFNDDVVSLSLANNASQESLLYNIM